MGRHVMFLLLCLEILGASSKTILNTKELRWVLTNQDNSITVPAEVPGGVYGNLMRSGVLSEGDFYYRFNDLNYRNVSYQNWTFFVHFQVPEAMWNETRIVLEFDGLDTIAKIKLNGLEVGASDNMFVEYSFDVKPLLKRRHDQKLQIFFESPVEWSRKAFNDQARHYEVPPKCPDPSYKGECHVNHIRKMQSSFAWDWGPAFPDMGVWKPWRLVGWTSLRLRNILFETEPLFPLPRYPHEGNITSVPWKVKLKIIFESAVVLQELSGNLTVGLDGQIFVNKTVLLQTPEFAFVIEEEFSVPEGIEPWWPNGYGGQRLYNLTVTWGDIGEKEEKKIRVGFRTVELDQTFLDENKKELGRHFRFLVNNVTLFLKGSNWIPSHALPDNMDPAHVRRLLRDAARTHQNCLRVWGGGIYESDEFYETADELGILIWQDFMFACAMYPTTGSFLRSVKDEVKTQVGRLQHHPSILVWAGNNENEAALVGNWYGNRDNFEIYKRDYVKLYVDTIRSVTEDLEKWRPFVISSPSNGIQSELEGYISRHPYDNKYGDVHFYDYFSNGWNWTTYPRSRLVSEYGFQSWPSFRTLKKATAKEDWNLGSSMMNHRQHHPTGNLQLLLQLLTHFSFSKFLKEQDSNFEHYLYLTQVNQAVAVKTETEFYRRSMSVVTSNGEGLTSGALYWQLNDIWQGASWSSIEYGGRWKMLHYFARNFFKKVLLSPWIDGDKVKINVINDGLEAVRNLSLSVELLSYLQMHPLKSLTKGISSVESQRSEEVVRLDLEQDIELYKLCRYVFRDPKSTCFLKFYLTAEDDPEVNQENFLLLAEPRKTLLRKANIKIKSVAELDENRGFKVLLQTDSVALFVWLETDVEGEFSDNGFILTQDSKVVYFEPSEEATLEDFETTLTVTSLSDTCDFEDEDKDPMLFSAFK